MDFIEFVIEHADHFFWGYLFGFGIVFAIVSSILYANKPYISDGYDDYGPS